MYDYHSKEDVVSRLQVFLVYIRKISPQIFEPLKRLRISIIIQKVNPSKMIFYTHVLLTVKYGACIFMIGHQISTEVIEGYFINHLIPNKSSQCSCFPSTEKVLKRCLICAMYYRNRWNFSYLLKKVGLVSVLTTR